MSAPLFRMTDVQAGTVGWDAIVRDNFAATERHLDRQPTQVKRAYRASASNPQSTPIDALNLVAFNPTQYHGHLVFILDPEGGEGPLAYSDGSAWVYALTGNAVTIS